MIVEKDEYRPGQPIMFKEAKRRGLRRRGQNYGLSRT